jgi:hypothetical protein
MITYRFSLTFANIVTSSFEKNIQIHPYTKMDAGLKQCWALYFKQYEVFELSDDNLFSSKKLSYLSYEILS